MKVKFAISFGIALGVLFTCAIGLMFAAIDDTRSYHVIDTDDHSVTLRAENGPIIEVQLENVPDVSCFETGALWTIDYRP